MALTFDDAGLDDYSVAFPVLQSHRFVATFFVITGFVGKPICMTRSDLQRMQTAGMAIESHMVHRFGPEDPRARSCRTSSFSRARPSEKELGQAPMALAYPAGAYSQAVIAAARAAGYRVAVTSLGASGARRGVLQT